MFGRHTQKPVTSSPVTDESTVFNPAKPDPAKLNPVKLSPVKLSPVKKDSGDGLVWVSAKSLISLRHLAESISLHTGKIRASQAGGYVSPFKGRGMEFDEVRPYQPGDDVRSIDWRVTARTGTPHTKLYREERERAVILWVDYRSSMFFATQSAYKSVVAAKMASILSWSAASQGDRLGGLIFTDTGHQEIRPQRGKLAALHFLKQLADHPAWQSHSSPAGPLSAGQGTGQNMVQQAFSRLRRVARPGSLLVLISDFRDFDEQSQAHLSQLSRHNDVVMILVYDVLEAELPPAGYYRIGNEDGTTSINTMKAKVRSDYSTHFQQRLQHIRTLCARLRVRFVLTKTGDDILATLQQGFGSRKDSRR